MDVLLGFVHSPVGAPTAIGMFAAVAFAAVFPLRGGNGQHAGAGPGAVSVWQIRDTMQSAATRQPESHTMTEEECRAYLDQRCRRILAARPAPYVGKHRLAIEDLVDEFYPTVTITPAPGLFRHHTPVAAD